MRTNSFLDLSPQNPVYGRDTIIITIYEVDHVGIRAWVNPVCGVSLQR